MTARCRNRRRILLDVSGGSPGSIECEADGTAMLEIGVTCIPPYGRVWLRNRPCRKYGPCSSRLELVTAAKSSDSALFVVHPSRELGETNQPVKWGPSMAAFSLEKTSREVTSRLWLDIDDPDSLPAMLLAVVASRGFTQYGWNNRQCPVGRNLL